VVTCPHCTNDDPRLIERHGSRAVCLVCARVWVVTP